MLHQWGNGFEADLLAEPLTAIENDAHVHQLMASVVPLFVLRLAGGQEIRVNALTVERGRKPGGSKDPPLLELADFVAEIGYELVQRNSTLVAFGAMADRGSAGFGFLAAQDEHVRDFFHLGVADFGLQLFVALV